MRGSDVRRYVPDLAATWPLDERASTRHDATVVFADVAGFTKLSERLAKLGPEGSEAVKEIINAVFEPTLDAVLQGGGDIVKFAGDGFLSMFVGDDHAARAARAAASMQRSMRELATFRTPAGRVRPRLTVGAETGTVDVIALGQPGAERRDIVATGAVIDRVFEIESAARDGQVCIGARLAAALDARWIMQRSSNDDDTPRLRITRVPEQPARRLVRPSTEERAFEFLDPAVAHVITSGSSPAEHRTVAVAFVIVDDVVASSATDPDASEKRLNAIASGVARACREHDVCWLETDAEHDRIRFLLTVGAPQRREHDTERLLDVVRSVVGTHGLRAGVARGRAFVGDVGHQERRTYNVMGPVVNLAARLASNAAPGSTLVSADVVELMMPKFFLTSSPPLRLKGFAGAVAVAELGDRRPSRIDVSTRSALHGRDEELHRCSELVERLRDGVGAAVEIVAGAGVGKSRLVEEIEGTAPCAVHRADGRRDRETMPYGAIAPLVRSVLGIPPASDGEEAGRLVLERVESVAEHLLAVAPLIAAAAQATVPDTPESGAVARPFRGARTREVVVELLAATVPKPALFIAEDMHWFDDASRLLVSAIAISARERPWLVVGTRRPVADPPDGFDTIRLEPLADQIVRRVVTDEIGDAAMTRRQLDEIVRAADGNPLFAIELARAATRITGSTLLPDRVEDIISSRIDDLDLDSRSMLRDLSVAGVEPDAATVDALMDEHGMGDEALGVLSEFITITGHGIKFRHELYRRAAYEGLPIRRRRELHRRLATQLAAREDATQHAAAIAEHAHHGRDAVATWLWTRTAAAEALAQGATHEAATHLQRSLQALPDIDISAFDEARVAEMLGDAQELAGRPDEAHAAYRRARRALADLPIECARLCRKHARVDERAGRYRASLRWTTMGLKLLDEDPNDEIAAELRLVAGVVRFFQGRFDESIALATAAAEAAERVGATMPLAQAHLQLEMAYSELGRKVERARHGAYALELLERLDDQLGLANLHLNLGVSQYNEANWPRALDHYERSAHHYRRVGDTIGAEAARNNQAEILTDQGRLDEAASILADVERALRAARYQLGVAITTSGRARVALHSGRLSAAEALLDEARRGFADLDARHMVLDTDVRRVEHLVWAGQISEAVALAESAERDLAELGPVAVLPATLERLRGWAALHDGDVDLAVRHFRQGLELARAEEFAYEVALAQDALVLAGRGAVERLEVARQLDELGVVSPPRPPWSVAA